MIRIEKNNITKIYTTFTERMENIDNDVLIIFDDETNPGNTYSVLLENNLSNIIDRIDIYEIEEDMNIVDGSTHSITFPHIGFYTYDAYEVITGTNSINVGEPGRDCLYNHIEKGRCKVYGDPGGHTQSLIDDVYL